MELPNLPPRQFILATIHRAENTDDPARFRSIIEALASLEVDVLLPVHPRLRARAAKFGVDLDVGSIKTCEPLDYPVLVAAVTRARAVITDSGGLQKEAFLLRKPCVTVRPETEWPETVELGWNALAADPADIPASLAALRLTPTAATPYGDGKAAAAAVRAIRGWEAGRGA